MWYRRFIKEIIVAFELFWQAHPALLYGLFFYFGTFAVLSPSHCYCIPLFILIWPVFFCKREHSSLFLRLIFAFLIGLGAYFATSVRVTFPPDTCQSLQGIAVVEIEDVTQGIRFGVPFWKYRLTISSLSDEKQQITIRNVSCSMAWKDFALRPEAGYSYEVEGVLKAVKDRHYVFSPVKGGRFIQRASRFSFVEMRLEAKMFFKKFIRSYLPPTEARTFLEGLFSGEFHDQFLAQNLRRLGLAHIMVVSGFHFSLLVAFMSLLLRILVSRKCSAFLLLIISTTYLLFIGTTPSVLRAWISIIAVLLAILVERKANGLNSLGIGLIAVLSYDPAYSLSLAFQLSFLATGAILLFYSLCDRFLTNFFPVRSISFVKPLPYCDQSIYFLLIFFRKAWALDCAVYLLMLPMSLYCFKTHSFLGMLYGSFFPFLVSLCMILFVFASLFCWFPILAKFFFSLSHFLADFSLTFVSFIPETLDRNIRVEMISDWLLALYLTTACCIGILFFSKRRNSDNEELIH